LKVFFDSSVLAGLGLSGTVDQERYFALCDNLNPVTKEQLTPVTRGNRRVLYDFTFDAPKSVSLAYELGGDERIMDAFRLAVVDTMSEMEGAMMARVRGGGKFEDRATSNMAWAEFIHRTTRPLTDVSFRQRCARRSVTITMVSDRPV
jgi:conjugative relaxase-like TrwC/TraI family protein